jgi:hypothetical protein
MPSIHHVASWILLATITIFRCDAKECPVPTRLVLVPHQVMTFATREDCEGSRVRLARVTLPVTSSPARPDLTIRQQITYVCKEG